MTPAKSFIAPKGDGNFSAPLAELSSQKAAEIKKRTINAVSESFFIQSFLGFIRRSTDPLSTPGLLQFTSNRLYIIHLDAK
jgi:hypothetical protein